MRVPMAFRVRVLHSLLLGLAGFSLVLCSFFYATPVALHYGDPASAPAAAAIIGEAASSAAANVPVEPTRQAPSASAAGVGGGELDPQAAGGKRSLQASADVQRPSGQAQDVKPSAVVVPAEVQPVKSAPNKNTTEIPVKGPSNEKMKVANAVASDAKSTKGANGPADAKGTVNKVPAVAAPGSQKTVEVVPPQPAAPAATADAPALKANATNRQASVIQKINPKNTAIKGSPTDFTSLGIVTKAMYESGHDIPNAELCPDFGKSLKVVILITSAPNHADARMAIRQTWGHYAQRKDISIAFLLGTTADTNIQKDIYSESVMYGDLIQSHFQDSYNNLTLKTISLLEWVDTYCYQVNFILKTDDDMFINVPRLLAFIEKHSNDKRTIFGRLAKKWKPIRNKKSKYYVSKEQYKHVLFPDFTTGPAYLMTGDVVHDLYTSALNQTYLKLEDVYTTGIVAQEMKVKRVHVNEFLNKRIVFHACHIQKGISIHMVKFHEQFDLWKKLLDGKTKCK